MNLRINSGQNLPLFFLTVFLIAQWVIIWYNYTKSYQKVRKSYLAGGKIMEYTIIKLTSKGQMTLPLEIREKLKLDKGDYLAVYLEGEEIRLKKIDPFKSQPLREEDPIWSLIGKYEDKEKKKDISENHDRYLAEGEVERWNGS